MREGEAKAIVGVFKKLGVKVEVIDARKEFFRAFKGVTDPEEKREAVTQTFYKTVFGPLVKKSKAKFLLQGTNYTDVEETVAGIKRQHNILAQLGIDTKKEFGYHVLEPIMALRKTGVRRVAKALGLPREIYERPPFPGPALAARVIGEVTPERVAIVRAATKIVEEELRDSGAFQYLAILHADKVTGIRNNKREFGFQIEVRCW
jgi:GMP synthase (glutamine-hydrolysing)